MSELMDMLQEMDKELGGGGSYEDLPDGVYFSNFNRETSKASQDPDNPYFRLGWRVTHGAYAGREIGDFVRWFGPNEGSTKARQAHVIQTIKALVLAGVDETALDTAFRAVRVATTEGEVAEALTALMPHVEGVRIPVRLRTNKNDYQNASYLEKGGLIDAPDPARTEAVKI